MTAQRRIDEFLACATEAEHMAVKTVEQDAQAAWLRIAESYRELARRQGCREGSN
jgi:hypothetical protein